MDRVLTALTARLARCRSAIALCVLALTGCATVGSQFGASALSLLQPGVTTLDEASILMQSPPVDIYRGRDGAALARWAHSASLITDAVYLNRELWLRFDAGGHYTGVERSINIPHNYLYGQ